MSEKSSSSTSDQISDSPQSRRRFIAGAGAAAGLSIVSPQVAFGAEANEKIRIGFVGCGGRGGFVGSIVAEDGGFEITAAADYFQDRVDGFGEKFGVDAKARFTGLGAIDKMLASGLVDAVAVHSPPYFHPEHVAKSVDAGKHVLVAKPIAVDVPGVRSVEASTAKAAEAGLSVMVDVQSRGDEFFQGALGRVRDGGALGEFTYGRCMADYGAITPQAEDDGSPEARLRNWVFDIAYSGDIITEQNIHAVDIFAWALGAPKRAYGVRGRKARLAPGDTSDHYVVNFEYENGGAVSFTSRQYNAFGSPGAIDNEIYGTKGVLFTQFAGTVMIRGGKDSFYRGGKSPNLYKTGSVTNVAQFRDAIRAGKPDVTTVPGAVETTLVTVLGRQAGVADGALDWDTVAADTTKLTPDLTGLKS